MNFKIQTTSYFDREAKQLAKRHRSLYQNERSASDAESFVRLANKELRFFAIKFAQ